MKKVLFSTLAMCAIALGFSACSKEDDEEMEWKKVSYTTSMQAVDLGLTSGTKWGIMNVGAAEPEGYGDYFAWGDTASRGENWKTEKRYNWTYAPFNNGQKNCDLNYYKGVFNDVCPGGTLSSEYDAATQLCGSDWRMPTESEWKELAQECTWEWTDNYNDKGVAGYIVYKDNKDNQIFLPAAGKRSYSTFDDCRQGFYWSSTSYYDEFGNITPSTYALCMYYNRNAINAKKYTYYRYFGFPIRPVRK